MEARLNWDRGSARLAGTIVNNTAYDLHDCQVVVPGGTIDIGNVNHGATAKVDGTSRGSSIAMPPPSSGAMPAPSSGSKSNGRMSQIEEDTETQLMPRIARDGEATLVGWSRTSPADIELRRGRGDRQNANCFLFRFPLERAAAITNGGGRHL
jgi:hypothetical protein